MSNSYKFYSDTKDIMKKYVNATEGAIIYGISKSRIMVLASEAGAVYKVGNSALINTDIRVNAVAPGITETDMMKAVPKEVIEPMIERIPLRRLGQPEDIANAFVFLASDEASYITGVILSVDGMARS